MSERCPRCGHRFIEGHTAPVRDDLCHWCVDEIDNPSYCHVCNRIAKHSGQQGYLCGAKSCSRIDGLLSEIEFIKKYRDD